MAFVPIVTNVCSIAATRSIVQGSFNHMVFQYLVYQGPVVLAISFRFFDCWAWAWEGTPFGISFLEFNFGGLGVDSTLGFGFMFDGR